MRGNSLFTSLNLNFQLWNQKYLWLCVVSQYSLKEAVCYYCFLLSSLPSMTLTATYPVSRWNPSQLLVSIPNNCFQLANLLTLTACPFFQILHSFIHGVGTTLLPSTLLQSCHNGRRQC